MSNNLRNIKDIDYITINIASPEKILSWSHGEVIKPETLNYRTQRPEKDGLFQKEFLGQLKIMNVIAESIRKLGIKEWFANVAVLR